MEMLPIDVARYIAYQYLFYSVPFAFAMAAWCYYLPKAHLRQCVTCQAVAVLFFVGWMIATLHMLVSLQKFESGTLSVRAIIISVADAGIALAIVELIRLGFIWFWRYFSR